MKVLVTGAAGFIGSHVVDALCARGDQVIGLDSLDPGVHHREPAYLRSEVDYCFADLRTFEPDSRFDDVEAIVHLAALGGVSRAAREPANVITANCGGTARLIEASRRWTHLQVVFLSSSFSIYGANYRYRCSSCDAETDGGRNNASLLEGNYEVLCPHCGHPAGIRPITEAASPAPLETYGASKYMQELCFRDSRNAACRFFDFRQFTVSGFVWRTAKPRLSRGWPAGFFPGIVRSFSKTDGKFATGCMWATSLREFSRSSREYRRRRL